MEIYSRDFAFRFLRSKILTSTLSQSIPKPNIRAHPKISTHLSLPRCYTITSHSDSINPSLLPFSNKDKTGSNLSNFSRKYSANKMASTLANENATPHTHDHANLSPVEASKRRAAYKAVEDHFDPFYKYVGIGSGSTVVYVVEAIAAKGRDITSKMIFVPTGDQSRQLIIEAGLPLGSIDSLPPVVVEPLHLSGDAAFDVSTGLQDLGLKGKRESLDVAFDGADEIDEDLNCIKGGGACLFQEKLVATSSKKFVCVAG